MAAATTLLAWTLGLGLAALVVGELAARLWLRLRARYWVWTPFRRIHMEIDRETLPTLEPLVRFEVNRDGERGDDPPPTGSSIYRTLVVGGSAAECYLLDQPSSWPYVLQALLNEEQNLAQLGASRAHVGNAGRSLVPCWYIHRMLEKTLPHHAPLDLAIVMVGASDLVGWLEKKGPAEVLHGGLPTSSYFGEHPEGPFGWRPRGLALRRLAARLHQRLVRPVERRRQTGKRIAANRAMRARAKVMLDSTPDPTPMLESYARDLRRVIDLLQQHVARVIVVGQPWFDKDFDPEERAIMWNFGAGRPYEQEVTDYYTHRVARALMGQVDAVTARVAADKGVEHVDLMPVLERSLTTYYDFFHFTPAGARQVARRVAQVVLEPRPPRTSTGARGTGDEAHEEVAEQAEDGQVEEVDEVRGDAGLQS